MQNSTQWHRTVVYPKPHIPRMEEERILVVDSSQSYASPNILPFISINSSVFTAGAGKRIFWYAVSGLLIGNSYRRKAPPLSRTSRTCEGQVGFDRVSLL